MGQYKDSGISWVGKIPDNWQVLRNKNTFLCSKDYVGEKSSGTQLLSLTTKGIRAIKFGETSGKVPDSYDTYQIVKPNNLVMCLFDLDCSAVFSGISIYEGMISPAYKVLSCKTNMMPQFANYWFIFVFDGRKFMHYSKNIRYSLTYDEFCALKIIVPPIEDQQRIADYLDLKCGEIDSLIGLQEQMIEKLKAYKQSVITEAVTKGLDPNAKLVPSGIDWIGEIPEGWKVIKTKYIADKIYKGNGITKDEVFVDGDTPCVRYGEIYSKYTHAFKTCFSATNKDIQKSPQLFHYGDILCAGTGELVEEIGKSIVYLGSQECLAGGDIIIIQHHQNPSFLNYALNSNYAQTQKSKGKAKLKVVHISAFEIGSTFILLPPLSEQRSIASYLDSKCADIDQLIALKQQKIEKLKEYKKSVIYEAVTGKTNIE